MRYKFLLILTLNTFALNTFAMEQEQTEQQKKFPCKVPGCSESFNNDSTLRRHMNIHNKTHVCNECQLPCGSSSELKNHVRIHTGEKSFVCEQCNQAFTQKINLTNHQKTKKCFNQSIGVAAKKTFKCTFPGCGKSFARNFHLRRHNISTHLKKNTANAAIAASMQVDSENQAPQQAAQAAQEVKDARHAGAVRPAENILVERPSKKHKIDNEAEAALLLLILREQAYR